MGEKTLREIIAELKKVPRGQESRNATEAKILDAIIKRVDENSEILHDISDALDLTTEDAATSDPIGSESEEDSASTESQADSEEGDAGTGDETE